MDGNALGKALAFVGGDLRDWPLACACCGSENGYRNHERDEWACCDCKQFVSMHIMGEYQYERASREVTGRPVKPLYPIRSAP